MDKLILVIILLSAAIQGVEANECIFAGKWAPNIEKTKASIQKSKKLTEEQKSYITNITNKMINAVIVNSCHDFTVYRDGTKETTKLIDLKITNNIAIAEYYDKSEQRVIKTKSVLIGDCYYVEIPDIDVNDYYCKIKQK